MKTIPFCRWNKVSTAPKEMGSNKQRKRRFENLQFVGNGFYCEIRNRNFRKSIDKAVEMC